MWTGHYSEWMVYVHVGGLSQQTVGVHASEPDIRKMAIQIKSYSPEWRKKYEAIISLVWGGR